MADIKELNNENLTEVAGGNITDDLVSKIEIGATYQQYTDSYAPVKYFIKITNINGDTVAGDLGKIGPQYYGGKIIVKYGQLNSYPINFLVKKYNIEEKVTKYRWFFDD